MQNCCVKPVFLHLLNLGWQFCSLERVIWSITSWYRYSAICPSVARVSIYIYNIYIYNIYYIYIYIVALHTPVMPQRLLVWPRMSPACSATVVVFVVVVVVVVVVVGCCCCCFFCCWLLVVVVVVVVVTRGGGTFSCLAPVRRESFRQTSVVSKAGLCELLIIGFSSRQTLPPASSAVLNGIVWNLLAPTCLFAETEQAVGFQKVAAKPNLKQWSQGRFASLNLHVKTHVATHV